MDPLEEEEEGEFVFGGMEEVIPVSGRKDGGRFLGTGESSEMRQRGQRIKNDCVTHLRA